MVVYCCFVRQQFCDFVISSVLCVLCGTVTLVYGETVQEAEAAKQYQELMEKQKVCSALCFISL